MNSIKYHNMFKIINNTSKTILLSSWEIVKEGLAKLIDVEIESNNQSIIQNNSWSFYLKDYSKLADFNTYKSNTKFTLYDDNYKIIINENIITISN